MLTSFFSKLFLGKQISQNLGEKGSIAQMNTLLRKVRHIELRAAFLQQLVGTPYLGAYSRINPAARKVHSSNRTIGRLPGHLRPSHSSRKLASKLGGVVLGAFSSTAASEAVAVAGILAFSSILEVFINWLRQPKNSSVPMPAIPNPTTQACNHVASKLSDTSTAATHYCNHTADINPITVIQRSLVSAGHHYGI